MLTILAISNYRSLRNLIVPLRQLNVITGPNGSGKSSLYRALGASCRHSTRPRRPLAGTGGWIAVHAVGWTGDYFACSATG